MSILILGATGATGQHLVQQLLDAGQKIKVIVRSPEKLPDSFQDNDRLLIVKAAVSDVSVQQMAGHLKDCTAVASCLGHNLSWRGIYGKPRRLVTDAVRLLCNAITLVSPDQPVKLVLMNTSGNRNRDLNEPISAGEKLVVGLLRLLLPPHPDNEKAADYLRVDIGQKHPHIEWVAVRPDSLINQDKVTDYEVFPSPIRSALFNPGKTSRINVGNFMTKLITDDETFNKWKGQMPVIYNKT